MADFQKRGLLDTVGTARTIDLGETEEEGLASFFSFLLPCSSVCIDD